MNDGHLAEHDGCVDDGNATLTTNGFMDDSNFRANNGTLTDEDLHTTPAEDVRLERIKSGIHKSAEFDECSGCAKKTKAFAIEKTLQTRLAKFAEAIAKLGVVETLTLPIDQKVIMMAAVATPKIAFLMEQLSLSKMATATMKAVYGLSRRYRPVTPALTLIAKGAAGEPLVVLRRLM